MTAKKDDHSNDSEFVPSLEKGLAVIELFGREHPDLTLSQISRELGLTPGSTRRILRTLEVLGYASAIDGRFRLTARVLNLGSAYLASLPFAEAARTILQDVANALEVPCSITMLDRREIVYLGRATFRRLSRDYVYVGARMPAYAVSPGKVLLAQLPTAELDRLLDGWEFEAFTPNTVASHDQLREQLEVVREQGYSINEQEIFMGHRSIAIPVRLDRNEWAAIVAATSISRHRTAELISTFLPRLRLAADEIERVACALV